MGKIIVKQEETITEEDQEYNAIGEALKDMALKIVKYSSNIPNEAGFALKNIESMLFLINFISSNTDIDYRNKQELQDIQKKVKVDLDKQQREYLLHQQMKTIQNELGANPVDEDLQELEEAAKKMPAVKLILNDGSVLPDSGRVESISGVINTSTGTAQVRATFPNASHLLHSGANGNVEVPVYYKDVIVIPQAATFELQDKVLVYKVVDGKAQSANIEVAPNNNGTEYIVTQGLNVGDVIIAEGAGLVREGTPVGTAQGAQNHGK